MLYFGLFSMSYIFCYKEFPHYLVYNQSRKFDFLSKSIYIQNINEGIIFFLNSSSNTFTMVMVSGVPRCGETAMYPPPLLTKIYP